MGTELKVKERKSLKVSLPTQTPRGTLTDGSESEGEDQDEGGLFNLYCRVDSGGYLGRGDPEGTHQRPGERTSDGGTQAVKWK